MRGISDFRNKLEQAKGQRSAYQKELSTKMIEKKHVKRDIQKHIEALEIVNQIARKTQEQIAFQISAITSMAMETVFPDPYKIVLEFVQRRGKSEADIFFIRDDQKIDPLSSSGGGAVDLASFALRIALWSMARPRSRNTIILDEPFKHLSADLMDKAGEMLREISTKLKLQIIMVTHSDNLLNCADKVFSISLKKGNSIAQASQ